MRVFVTGATGFIGSAIVRDLISLGHEVTGLARSAASARRLEATGAGVAPGTIDSLEVLRREAGRADGVIHTAFFHALSHMAFGTRMRVLLGGTPSGIVDRFTAAAVEADRKAIETMGGALDKGAPLRGLPNHGAQGWSDRGRDRRRRSCLRRRRQGRDGTNDTRTCRGRHPRVDGPAAALCA